MHRGRDYSHYVLSMHALNVCSSCPDADVMARRSTPEGRQQKSFCRRSCCVCVEQHIFSQTQIEAEAASIGSELNFGS